MTNLEEINLNNNLITTLPVSVGKLTKLTTLYASQNKISILPGSFGFFPALENIDLSHNSISIFPDGLCQSPKLQSISFRKNKIQKFPSSIHLLAPSMNYLALDSNEMKGSIPAALLENENFTALLLSHNQFMFEDIPTSTKLKNGLGTQQPVTLTKKVFNTAIGDTLKIDIRNFAPFHLESNQYTWYSYPQNKKAGSDNQPELTVVIDEKTINNQYYCVVTNPNSPSYKYTAFGYEYTLACLNNVTTEVISFQTATEEELISEKYDGNYVVSSTNISTKIVEDKTVTLVPPRHVRGKIQWQASSDAVTWHDLSANMAENDLKSNFLSVKSDELILSPRTPAYYRCAVTDLNCEPMYSDTMKVNPYGNVIFDGNVNVTEQSKTISIDSIEVTLPKGIYDTDFRVTIVKVDNPPVIEGLKMSSVYDVTTSFGSVFDVPLQIKLKNIDKNLVTDKDLPALKPAYFDETSKQWKFYDNGGVTLKDSSVFFLTNHLTKLAWFELAHGSYTHIHTGKRVNVIYKWDTGTGEENNYLGYYYSNRKKTPEAWYNPNMDPDKGGTPMIIQDVAGYMDIILDKFKQSGLETPSLRFNVYVSNLGSQTFGKIGLCGYLAGRGYFELNSALAVDRDELRSTLAHEYMHYTQDYYMVVLTDNYFFTEAHAPLADRLVWPTVEELEIAESERNLEMSLTTNTADGASSIFDLIGRSWDYASTVPVIEKFSVNTMDANLSSTFLHYMRSYRKDTKLNIAKLLINHGWAGSATNWTWRSFINSEVKNQLGTTIGDEFDDFVRFILSGENENFSVLNTEDGNPYTYLIRNLTPEDKGTFAKRLVYNFPKSDNQQKENSMEMNVPYLAAKTLLLYNQTPDRAVVINYKRLHDKSDDYKVYFGKFDFKTKKTEFVDISDSLSYNIFVEARSLKSVSESQNIAFLLFVNKTCPDLLSLNADFNASFELKATPVIDIESLYTAWIAGNDGSNLYVHYNSKGNKDAFLVEGIHVNGTSDNMVYHNVYNYSSYKTILNDSTYQVNAYFSDETRNEYPDLGAYPGIQLSTVQQTIEYNFVAGKIKLHSVSQFTNKFEIIENEKPKIILNSKWYNDAKLSIKDINLMNYSASGENVVLLRTFNSNETKAVVESMSHSHRAVDYDYKTGEVSSESFENYVSTDYSGGDVVLKILLRTR